MESQDKLNVEKRPGNFSQKKWLWLGIIIALLNPVFSGIILAAFYLTEPELRRAGKITAAVAIIWGALTLYIIRQYAPPFSL